MKDRPNPVAVGAFVIIGIALIVIAVALLGSGDFLKPKHKMVAYFSSDLNGLEKGSPVMFRGVKVGEVTDIQLIFDGEEHITVPVLFELQPDVVDLGSDNPWAIARRKQRIEECLEMGLCAKLILQSLVTGKSIIQLSLDPKADRTFHKHEGPEIQVPTLPSDLEQLKSSFSELPIKELVTRFISVFRALDTKLNSPELLSTLKSFQGTVTNLEKLTLNANSQLSVIAPAATTTLGDANKVINDVGKEANQTLVELRTTMTHVNTTMEKMQATLAGFDKQVNTVGPEAVSTLKNATATFQTAETSITNITKSINTNSPIQQDLQEALHNIATAAASINALTDYLNRHPEALLKGKK